MSVARVIPSLSAAIQRVDELASRVYLRVACEQCSLLVLMFHSLFLDDGEIDLHLMDPQQRMTVRHLHQLVEYYQSCGYKFVSPDDILADLAPGGRYVLITFDDGYFNNRRALPVLERCEVPAVFFIATDHVTSGRAFWWDVVYRERHRAGRSLAEIYGEDEMLKSRSTEQIEHYLLREFGPHAFRPAGDLDRPFSPSELVEFSRHPRVHIGNHTHRHAILTKCSAAQVEMEVGEAQSTLQHTTGKPPTAIAYPNGNYSDQIIRICQRLGLRLGITCDLRKNFLPLPSHGDALMRLGRYCPYANDRWLAQLEHFRSDLMLHYRCQQLKTRLVRARASQR